MIFKFCFMLNINNIFPESSLWKERGFWENGRVSSKHQESISSRRQQSHWQNLSDITILELWNLLKPDNVQGKTWRVCRGLFWSISPLSTVAATYPPPQPHGRQLFTVPGAAYTQLTGARMGKKGPYLPNIKNLCSDC